MPTPDKIDQLYDALKADGAVSKSRENFRSYMLASGDQGIWPVGILVCDD